jgi:hypothetical protein
MPYTGLIVPVVHESPGRYDVTVILARGGGSPSRPGRVRRAAGQAASGKNATVASAHTAGKIISVVTAEAIDQSAAVALAVVSGVLSCPALLSSR